MRKIYLVDSENVGDVWVPLLASSQPEEEVLVFYTQKSPHMNYENVRVLKETQKEAVFIKCFEGNNALDFQLVTELGYRLREDLDSEYIIVSNDTGFDAVVRYWTEREYKVCRLSGKECYRRTTGKRPGKERGALEKEPKPERITTAREETTVGKADAAVREETAVGKADAAVREETAAGKPDAAVREETAVERADAAACEGISVETVAVREHIAAAHEESVSQPREPEVKERVLSTQEAVVAEDVVKSLFLCIRKDNLVDFHNALVAFLGEESGKALYQDIKGNAEHTAYWAALPASGQKEKFEVYCRLVFDHSEFAGDAPGDFAEFLFESNGKRKNLNSLRAALLSRYGKDKGMKYYSLFKSHIKIMNHM